MATKHTLSIYSALGGAQSQIARDYLDAAPLREKINADAREALGDSLQYWAKKRKENGSDS